MSPRRKTPRPPGGDSRNGNPRPAGRAAIRADDEGPDALVAQIRAALADEDPMTLLVQASSMLNLVDPRNRDPFSSERQEPSLPSLDDLLEMFSTSDQPPMHGLAFAMAHLQPDELLRTRTLRRLDRATLPPWLAALGRVEVVDACLTVDGLYDARRAAPVSAGWSCPTPSDGG